MTMEMLRSMLQLGNAKINVTTTEVSGVSGALKKYSSEPLNGSCSTVLLKPISIELVAEPLVHYCNEQQP